nr:hypothetical protein [Tanacetum cinerariifolium]
MTDLQFVDQHNMMACLERIDGNAEFHQIVNFLTSSTIHYALTVSPTIYASYIKQFWATAKSKIVNDVKQIHAKVNGKTVVILESTMMSDLHFNDEDDITCLSNDEIFENLALMGYERVSTKFTFQKAFFCHQWKYLIHTILHCLSSKSTAWNEFSTNLASAVVCLAKGEGLGKPSEPQPPSLTAPPEQVLAAVSQPQMTHIPRRTKKGQDTKIPQSSGPPKKVGDEAVYTGKNDRVVRAATTAASLEAEQKSGNINTTRSTTTLNEPSPQGTGSGSGPRRHVTTFGDTNAQIRFETASKQSYNPPLSEDNTSGSREDNMKHQNDLTYFVTPTSHDPPLSRAHRPKSDEGMKLFKIGTSKKKTFDKENVSKQERDESNKTNELNLSDKGSGETKVFYYTTATKKDVNAIKPVSTAGHTASVIPDVSAAGPSTKEQAQYEREKRIAREKAAKQETKDAALIEHIKDVQERMDADELLAERLQQEEREQFTVNEQARMFVDLIAERKSKQQAENSKKRSRIDHDKESVKKQKLEEDDAEKDKLRACLDIVPVDNIAINVESFVTKYLIVNWKTHTLTESKMYYQIIRANRSSKNYKILTKMYDDFDRQDK